MANSIADETGFILPEQVIIYRYITISEIERESMQVPFKHIYVCIILEFSFVKDNRIRAIIFNESTISL